MTLKEWTIFIIQISWFFSMLKCLKKSTDKVNSTSHFFLLTCFLMVTTVLAIAKFTSFFKHLRLCFLLFAFSLWKYASSFCLRLFVFSFFAFFYVFVFFASSFLFVFIASLLLCVFVLWNMRFRSLKYASSVFNKTENDVNLPVVSTELEFELSFQI